MGHATFLRGFERDTEALHQFPSFPPRRRVPRTDHIETQIPVRTRTRTWTLIPLKPTMRVYATYTSPPWQPGRPTKSDLVCFFSIHPWRHPIIEDPGNAIP